MTFEEIENLVLGWSLERGLLQGTTAEKQTLKLMEELGELAESIVENAGTESITKDLALRLVRKIGELANPILKGAEFDPIKRDAALDAIGDCLVVMTQIAAKLDSTMTSCYDFAYRVIKDRKGSMVNGTYVKEEK